MNRQELLTLVRRYRQGIAATVVLIAMFAPLILLLSTAPVMKIEGKIRFVGENGTIHFTGTLDGINIENISQEYFYLEVKYVSMSGYSKPIENVIVPIVIDNLLGG